MSTPSTAAAILALQAKLRAQLEAIERAAFPSPSAIRAAIGSTEDLLAAMIAEQAAMRRDLDVFTRTHGGNA